MPKIDIPRHLNDFEDVFEQLCRTHDTITVYIDLVDMMVAFFQFYGDKELGDRLKKKYKNDYYLFSHCISELFKVYLKKIDSEKWYDGLGEVYEAVTSRNKSSRLGQFFTPKSVCDISAQMIVGKTEGGKVNDCASGSGRMLLAAFSVSPNNTFFATDIDPICAKMTAINMCIHGLKGQAVCANALEYQGSWSFGFEINPSLKFGLPGIEYIRQEHCVQSFIETNIRKGKHEQDLSKPSEKVKKVEEKVVQLSLF